MRVVAFILVLVPLSLFAFSYRPSAAPADRGEKWAVSTAHPIATRIGADVLRNGGTATDAAVAVSMALAVVYPEAGNIGGGFFAVGYQEDTGARWMVDARETAPGAVTAATFVTMPTDASRSGPYAAGVPGTVAGLALMHERYGKSPWSELVTPAARVAEKGFRLTPRLADKLRRYDSLRKDDNAREIFYRNEPVTGAALIQSDLGKTLKRLAADPRDFYEGRTAELMLADARQYGGPFTAGDLKYYEAKWREPVTCRYRGFTIVSSAPPSSGGTILCQTAQILESFLLSALPMTGATVTHLTLEAWRQAFHDRRLLGDPDYVDNPVEELISPAYGKHIASLISLDSAGVVTEPTRPYKESMQTTHFSIVDKYGNAVAVTTTLNAGFGNKHVVTGAGFLLNNEMDDFNTRPGEPNMYGLVQGNANIPAPGKRMLSSMSPTLLFWGDKLVLVVGTPGGPTIPTTVWQVLMRLIDGGWVLDRAVAWPRFHYQGVPDSVWHEPKAFPPQIEAELESMGYEIPPGGRVYGQVNAIAWDTGRNGWLAVADPRGEGTAEAE